MASQKHVNSGLIGFRVLGEGRINHTKHPGRSFNAYHAKKAAKYYKKKNDNQRELKKISAGLSYGFDFSMKDWDPASPMREYREREKKRQNKGE